MPGEEGRGKERERLPRDVVAVINIKRRALEKLAEGAVPLPPMPNDPTPEVSWMPMTAWARRKSLGATA